MTTLNKSDITSLVSNLVNQGAVSVLEWKDENHPIPEFNDAGRRIIVETILLADPKSITDFVDNDGEIITYLLNALYHPQSNAPATLGNHLINFITDDLINDSTMWDMIDRDFFHKELSEWFHQDFIAHNQEHLDNGYYWKRGQ